MNRERVAVGDAVRSHMCDVGKSLLRTSESLTKKYSASWMPVCVLSRCGYALSIVPLGWVTLQASAAFVATSLSNLNTLNL